MDITTPISKDKKLINSYGNKGFEINKTFYKKTIILSPEQIREIDFDGDFDLINPEDLSQIIKPEAEILLIGGGSKYPVISDQFIAKIKKIAPNISVNQMNSPAACRTYNFLLTEGREVVVIIVKITE